MCKKQVLALSSVTGDLEDIGITVSALQDMFSLTTETLERESAGGANATILQRRMPMYISSFFIVQENLRSLRNNLDTVIENLREQERCTE